MMEQVIQGSLKLVKKQEKANLNMEMVHIILEVFIIINYMGKEHMFGLMGENIMGIGKIIE